MSTRYSTCHFAEVMFGWKQAKHLGGERKETIRCSWCGKVCDLVPPEKTLMHDLELTLRRWKDGDCTLDDMFNRVDSELYRSWYEAFGTAANTLQAKSKAKYSREIYSDTWEAV